MCVTINNSELVLVSMHRRSGTRSPNVNMNNVKRMINNSGVIRIRQLFMLCKITSITYINFITMNVRIFLFQNAQSIVR